MTHSPWDALFANAYSAIKAAGPVLLVLSANNIDCFGSKWGVSAGPYILAANELEGQSVFSGQRRLSRRAMAASLPRFPRKE